MPGLSADPMRESKLENDVVLELLEVPTELVDGLPDEEPSFELSRLVCES